MRVAEQEATPLKSPTIKYLRLGLGATVMILGIVLLAGLSPSIKNLPKLSPQSTPAPNFKLMTFDGRPLQLTDFLGKVVVLNFWASWCIPCKVEAPTLQLVWTHYQSSGQVVFI